jgi:hypothetical protein
VSRRFALLTLFAAAALLLLTVGSGHPAARWGFTAAVLVFPVALIGLGTAARRGAPAPRWPVWLVAALVGGGGAWVLVASERGGEGRLAGLPTATAVLVGVLGIVTLVAVVVAYGLTFDRLGVSDRQLDALRRRRRR